MTAWSCWSPESRLPSEEHHVPSGGWITHRHCPAARAVLSAVLSVLFIGNINTQAAYISLYIYTTLTCQVGTLAKPISQALGGNENSHFHPAAPYWKQMKEYRREFCFILFFTLRDTFRRHTFWDLLILDQLSPSFIFSLLCSGAVNKNILYPCCNYSEDFWALRAELANVFLHFFNEYKLQIFHGPTPQHSNKTQILCINLWWVPESKRIEVCTVIKINSLHVAVYTCNGNF